VEANNAALGQQLEEAALLVRGHAIKRAGIKLDLFGERPLGYLQAQCRAALHQARSPSKWGRVAREVDLHAAKALRQHHLRQGVRWEAVGGRSIQRECNDLKDLLI
jgi:hypothetical protein